MKKYCYYFTTKKAKKKKKKGYKWLAPLLSVTRV